MFSPVHIPAYGFGLQGLAALCGPKDRSFERKMEGITIGVCVAIRVYLSLYLICRRLIINDVICVVLLLLLWYDMFSHRS
jgi:hypothetical protein